MAFNELLATHVRNVLGPRPDITEKKMFGGLAFLRDGKMFVGVVGDELMVRVGPLAYAKALESPHARPMDFTGRPMKGYVFVDADGCEEDAEVRKWVHSALTFVGTLTTETKSPVKKSGTARK